ncbi:hypothetical protein EKO04_000567 [Ascochyta lentis]|uniref:MYND-type domain-containing protein n=1 Tax=Ascochyta lentis TaxID=205686 RepID=A0A8H7ML83_9PLEO|nr:hypothetical protein EKO04_000567 [Ascochyta lentis]
MGAWGNGLFQSDNDFDTLSELGHEMGLTKLEEDMQTAAKASGKSDEEVNDIYLSIYGGGSHPDVVRKYLDSGVLVDLLKTKEAKMLSMPDGTQNQQLEYLFRDPCYGYVLLGACAMTLGCHLPESCIAMLKIVYTEGGLMPDALKQMRKALFGPDGFKDGESYDFESKSLLDTANSMNDDFDSNPSGRGFRLMNFMSPGGIFNTGMGNSTDSVIMKELRNKLHNPGCARCKDRMYCSSVCQKKHWKVHKKLCNPVKA